MSLTPKASLRSGGRFAAVLPVVLLALCAFYMISAFKAPKEASEFQLGQFGGLPVVDLGRVKPLDTLARTSLMVISNKQTMYLKDGEGTSDHRHAKGLQKVSAMRWLMDVMTKPEARNYTVLRIDHPEVLALIHADRDRMYFSVNEIMEHRDVLSDQIERARAIPSSDLSPFQHQLLRLAQSLEVYFKLEDVTGLLLIPPAHEGKVDTWQSFVQAQKSPEAQASPSPAIAAYPAMFQAWAQNQPADFNAALTGYLGTLEQGHASRMARVRFETLLNNVQPFMHCMTLYVLVFVLAIVSWLGMSRPLLRAAMWILLLTIVMHTFGLVTRIYIQGRPPVTNLYSSAVFVGWGAVILGIVLERFYRNGIGAVTAAGTGFLTLLIAHNLSLDGDTMTMMQAVLDTNFWLATHVVVITLGYASTFLAGFLGIVYILRGVLTRGLTPELGRSLSRMIYGIIAFATLFSFVGTILGGIWADQSWGRFWGWDPKENGALLIVLWNALVLHARMGGMARQRGVAALAVGGNIVTSWSWFGTNMLGVGLHAYGFIDSAIFWMLTFVASQLAIIGLAMIPQRHWRSTRAAAAATRTAAPAAPGTPILPSTA